MGSEPVTMVTNSVHRHDQSINFGNLWFRYCLTRNSQLQDCEKPHGTVESNYQHHFSINVWCVVNGDQMIGPYIFPRLTGDIYTSFLQDEQPAVLENVPLQILWQMYYQHNGPPPHFSQVIRQYLNHNFPNRWIGRGGAQNWPPWSPDLNPLDYHMGGYMKAMVYAHEMNTTEILQQILSVERNNNNAAVLQFSGHKNQKMHASKQRTLRTMCLNVEQTICNCTFNNVAQ